MCVYVYTYKHTYIIEYDSNLRREETLPYAMM